MNRKSIGGWQPFRSEDDPQIPGQESEKVFSKEGLIVIVLILIILMVGDFIYAKLFGSHA